MGLQPIDDCEQPIPIAGEFEGLQRALRKPRGELRLAGARDREQTLELRCVALLAGDSERIVQTVDPGCSRQTLLAENSMIDFSPFDAHARHRGNFHDPCAYRVEAFSQLGRAWAFYRQA